MATYRAKDMRRWLGDHRKKQIFVVRKSIQDISRLAQTPKAKGGRMPVHTGFLRNSYQAGLRGTTSLQGPNAYSAVVAQLEIGDVFQAGWTAPYALRREKGFVGTDSLGRYYNESGDFFMEGALMQWPAVVEKNARAVQ